MEVFNQATGELVWVPDDTEIADPEDLAVILLSSPEYAGDIKRVAKECGVTENKVKGWLRKAEFTDRIDLSVQSQALAHVGSVWEALVDRCKTGDVGAIKLYFEMTGKYKQRIDVTSNASYSLYSSQEISEEIFRLTKGMQRISS